MTAISLRFPLFVLSAAVAASAASAQMSVHVVAGAIKDKSPTALSVALDPTSSDQFHIDSGSSPSLNFPSDLRDGTTAPGQFSKQGDFALLYYYGFGDQRTAVAVRDLGSDAFTKAKGTVAAYDKKTRTLTLKDDGGKDITLALDDHLVLDTDMGVQSGRKYSPHKGDHVRVTYTGSAPGKVILLGKSL